jgi:hypothetical protein
MAATLKQSIALVLRATIFLCLVFAPHWAGSLSRPTTTLSASLTPWF